MKCFTQQQFKNKQKKYTLLYLIALIVGAIMLFGAGNNYFTIYLFVIISLEVIAYLLSKYIGIPSGVFLSEKLPVIPTSLIYKYFAGSFDAELGWTKNKNISKLDNGIPFSTDQYGSRRTGDHEYDETLVSTYGDSYTFCRESRDEETWQKFLSDILHTNVLNFGVGNYGFDQALLRLEREYKNNPTEIVIIGIVPQTIARIQSVWKHFNEHGNILGFKPRFIVNDNGGLELMKNPVQAPDDMFDLDGILDYIASNDRFYSERYVPESVKFSYLSSLIINYKRFNVLILKSARKLVSKVGLQSGVLERMIMYANVSESAVQSKKLFNDPESVKLLEALIVRYSELSRKMNFNPYILVMPMKDDVLYAKNNGSYYSDFFESMKKHVSIIDLTKMISGTQEEENLFNKWHYSRDGNMLVAKMIMKELVGSTGG